MQGHKSGTELCIGVALGKRPRSVRETFGACISIFPSFDLYCSLLQSTSSHPQQILSGLLHVAIVLQDNNLTAADEYNLQRGAANASLVDWAGKKRAGNFAFMEKRVGHWEAGIVAGDALLGEMQMHTPR